MLGHQPHPWHSEIWCKSTKQSLWVDHQHKPTSEQLAIQQHGGLLSSSLGDKYQILCKEGQLDRALEVLLDMGQHCTVPSEDMYICFLKACIKRKALMQAKGVHTHLALHGLESNCSLSEYLVSTFVKCSDLDDALRLFHILPCRTVFCWTAIISGYADCGKGEEALKLYEHMCEENVEPNQYTFVSLLKACASIGALEEGKAIHADARRMGFDSNIFVVNTLVSMYSKCGNIVEAENAFDRLSLRNVVSWNVMLSAYVEQGEAEKVLQLYRQMQEECASADHRTFVYALQACCVLAEKDEDVMEGRSIIWRGFQLKCVNPDNLMLAPQALCMRTERSESIAIQGRLIKAMCLDIGQALHADARRKGLESDVFVGTSLVNMYGKCGSLLEAENVFSGLSQRNVVSWNVMLSVYVDHGEGEKALKLFKLMEDEGMSPEVRTYVICLQACCAIAEKGKLMPLEIGQALRACVSRKDFDSNMFVGSVLVTMYGKCGSMVEAENVFSELSQRSVVLWNAMLSAYVELGEGDKVFHLYKRMQEEGVFTDELTLVIALQACCLLADKEGTAIAEHRAVRMSFADIGRALHADAWMKGFESNAFVGNTLVSMYGKCRSILEAEDVFVGLCQHNAVSWNAMLTAFIEQGEGERALLMYRQLKEEGVHPNDRIFVSVLQACCILAEKDAAVVKEQLTTVALWKIGQALHAEAQRRGCDADIFVGSTLVGMYNKCRDIIGAENVFSGLVKRDVVAWTVMLSAYVEQGEGERALLFYRHMQSEGMSPNQLTFVNALQACCLLAEKEGGIFVEGRFTKPVSLEIGRALHIDAQRKGFGSDLFVCNIFISLYGKCGSIVEAEEVFGSLSGRNIVSWNAMLMAYVEQGQGEKGMQLYKQVQQEALGLDDVLLGCALQACSETGSLEICRQIHFTIASAGLEQTLLLETTLIHAYGSCASMVDAQAVFDTRPERDVVSWSALIAGYARTGNYEASLQIYEKMQGAHVKPNEVTFLSLLSACSHSGLVEKGVEYFESMCREYGLIQNIEHYVSIIDLLARAGDFTRVQDLLARMPMQPDLSLCICLLGACRKYGNVELGKHAFDRAVSLQPKYAASYILMSNIYAKAGLFDCAKQVDISRQKEGAWNNPGQSWIEHGQEVHCFVAGDHKKTQNKCLYELLQHMNVELKDEFTDHTFSGMTEKAEFSLCGHSERLAVAFGLLNTPAGRPIRVRKNTDVCTDCHTAIRRISEMEGKEIIIIDSTVVHQFKGGNCSCEVVPEVLARSLES